MQTAVESIDRIMQMMPYKEPFRFIDEITYIDDNRIEGRYLFDPGSAFYQGHFPDYPLTPGVILIEVMAQIGLVAFGLYLLSESQDAGGIKHDQIPVLASTDIHFRKRVLPGETTYVVSEKLLFRHKMLTCRVELLNESKGLIASGTISGFIAQKD